MRKGGIEVSIIKVEREGRRRKRLSGKIGKERGAESSARCLSV